MTAYLTEVDAIDMRRRVYADGRIDPAELEALFDRDEKAVGRDPAWTALFVEAVVDYLVMQVEPHGYVDDANAGWLIDRISVDGVVQTESELEALICVLEKARTCPARLAAFALQQVKTVVLEGKGPLADRRELEAGRVTRADVELMRRVLYAAGGDGNIAITRAEAEVLFDINDAVAGAENDPDWTDLFVKALANCLMAASGYVAPSREEAIRRSEWLASESAGIGDFFGRMVSGGLRGVIDAYYSNDSWAERNAAFDQSIRSSEAITEAEADWLVSRLMRDGTLHHTEKQLLQFIANESGHIHPNLMGLIDQVA